MRTTDASHPAGLIRARQSCIDDIWPWMLPGLQLSPLIEIFGTDGCGDYSTSRVSGVTERSPSKQSGSLKDSLLRKAAFKDAPSTESRKRRRQSLTADACGACRRSKTRCSNERPCPRCLLAKRPEGCIPWRHDDESLTASTGGAAMPGSTSNRGKYKMTGRSCPECRLRKVRCDSERPCSRCIKHQRTETCLAQIKDDAVMLEHAGSEQGIVNPFALSTGLELAGLEPLPSWTVPKSSVENGPADNREMSAFDEFNDVLKLGSHEDFWAFLESSSGAREERPSFLARQPRLWHEEGGQGQGKSFNHS